MKNTGIYGFKDKIINLNNVVAMEYVPSDEDDNEENGSLEVYGVDGDPCEFLCTEKEYNEFFNMIFNIN